MAFLHGLFGQGRNWMQIAKALAVPVADGGAGAVSLLVDLPDHGRSPWSEDFSFAAYAAQVAQTLQAAAPGEQWSVVGHSLGGKVAMMLALEHPDLVEKLIVVDVAPRDYGDLARFEQYIHEMQSLPLAQLTSRADAEATFNESDPGVKAFLLQNLRRDGDSWRWQVNLDLVAADAAKGHHSAIADWPQRASELPAYEGPVLWLAGGESRYVQDRDAEPMRALFPKVRLVTVKGASHWVHSDAPEVTIEALRRFITA